MRNPERLDELVAMSRRLGDPALDYAILGEGNTSAAADDETFWIKASGLCLRDIDAGGFPRVRRDAILALLDRERVSDDALREGMEAARTPDSVPLRPSVETLFHAYLLSLEGVQFVGHTHPTPVNAILCSREGEAAVRGRLFPDEIVCCGIAPVWVPYTDPGQPLARAIKSGVEAHLDRHGVVPRILLMQNHGLIALGRTAQEVESATAMAVKAARVLLGTAAFGGPNFLSEENVRRIYTRPDEKYRERGILGRGVKQMKALRWELTGAGLENFGRDGRASTFEVEPPGEGELLARVDACGICFSDIKILNLGGEHPRLRGRDLAREPVVMGHEVALTVEAVGPGVTAPFRPADRAIVQADVYYRGQGMAMGYRLPGGFSQYVRIGREILEGDEGCYLLPIPEGLGYAEAALCEPWACVEASYRYRPRRALKPRGSLLIFLAGDGAGGARWPEAPEPPGSVVALNSREAPPLPDGWPAATRVPPPDVAAFLTAAGERGDRFDDIILLGSPTAAQLETLLALVGKGGILAIVGPAPDEPVAVDVGRVHYEDVGIVGGATDRVAAAYDWTRSAELVPSGTAWFIGAGGPMGQMHLQRALSLPEPPRKIVATQNTGPRLQDLRERFAAPASRRGIEFVLLNPKEMTREALEARLVAETGGRGFDDVVCLVPSVETLQWAPRLLAPDGGLNIFAGVPVGTAARLDLRPVVEKGARFWGTSGSTIADLSAVARKLQEGHLETAGVVAAVAGIHGVREGLAAVKEGCFLGKTVIYPHLETLPLLSVAEVAGRYPSVGAKLTAGRYWNREAEAELLQVLG